MKDILTVIKKELKRFFTDYRMLAAMILPGILIYVIYSFMGPLISSNFNASSDYNYQIYTINVDETILNTLSEGFKTSEYNVTFTETTDLASAQTEVKNESIDLIIDYNNIPSMLRLNSIIICLFILSSCSYHIVSVQNERAGELNATYTLDISAEKKFPLDDYTAPKSLYMQICHDSVGKRQLALLNSYRNSIYFYNYETGDFIREIHFEKEGPNGILSLNGFYVKNMDSIYIYSKPKVELLLGDCKGHVKQRWSLMGKGKDWYLSMPQYLPGTVCPMVEMDNHLILTGFILVL